MAGASFSSMFGLMAAMVVAALLMISTTSQATNHHFPANGPEGVPCSAVISAFRPCKGFLMSSDSKPPQACCDGAKDMNERSPNKQDRIDACNCIKKALPLVGKYVPNRIPMIPKQCGLPFSLPAVTPNFDCTKVVGPDF